MESKKIDIIIIRGAPGSGKTQTAKSLARYFPKGVRLEVDKIRAMVISADWINQDEHINMLKLSSRLGYNFIQSGFSPVIIVDTFSGNKLEKFIRDLHESNSSMAIKVFGLYTNENELKRRIEVRQKGEFNDFKVCKKLNDDVLKIKYSNEYQIDTSESSPAEVARIIYGQLMNSEN